MTNERLFRRGTGMCIHGNFISTCVECKKMQDTNQEESKLEDKAHEMMDGVSDKSIQVKFGDPNKFRWVDMETFHSGEIEEGMHLNFRMMAEELYDANMFDFDPNGSLSESQLVELRKFIFEKEGKESLNNPDLTLEQYHEVSERNMKKTDEGFKRTQFADFLGEVVNVEHEFNSEKNIIHLSVRLDDPQFTKPFYFRGYVDDDGRYHCSNPGLDKKQLLVK